MEHIIDRHTHKTDFFVMVVHVVNVVIGIELFLLLVSEIRIFIQSVLMLPALVVVVVLIIIGFMLVVVLVVIVNVMIIDLNFKSFNLVWI